MNCYDMLQRIYRLFGDDESTDVANLSNSPTDSVSQNHVCLLYSSFTSLSFCRDGKYDSFGVKLFYFNGFLRSYASDDDKWMNDIS